jgi:hypothetical protein
VNRIGRRVLRTRSRVARQVALNFEMAISSIGVGIYPSAALSTMDYDHSQTSLCARAGGATPVVGRQLGGSAVRGGDGLEGAGEEHRIFDVGCPLPRERILRDKTRRDVCSTHDRMRVAHRMLIFRCRPG